MFKLLLISSLCFTALSLDTCYVNLGNQVSSVTPILDQGDNSVSLETCKYYCDTWEVTCLDIAGSSDDCLNYQCQAGSLTTGGCILYAISSDWYQDSDDARDQAFETCDESCWEDYNGQVNSDTDHDLVILEGSYTSPDCKAECENFNGDCWTYGCTLGCGGVRITDSECILTSATDDFIYTDDETAHYKKYICDIPDDTTGSIQVIVPDSEEETDGESATGSEGEEETEVAEETETENVIIDGEGNVSCTQAEVFSECNYAGDSAVVNLEVLELTWEPASWCVPEFQTLTLHNAFDLGGESSSYADSVSCATSIDYNFLQMQKGSKKIAKKAFVKLL